MKSERWQQIHKLLSEALERQPGERQAFLDQACAGDEELRNEVEALLSAHEKAGSFVEKPVLDLATQVLSQRQSLSLVGNKLGPYEVLSLLGRGGMGEVYQVRDTRLDRIDALKILSVEVASDPDRYHRFVREAKAASSLNHPNIATIYEIGESNNIHWIAMELVEGQTLADRMKDRQLTMDEVLNVGMQAAEALEEAHSKGITHRDIKPANLMITSKDRVKVLDFGLAKVAPRHGQESNTITQTRTGAILGTLQYMSPEQTIGEEVDHRTDIFSLGVVLYEMATGQQPFPASTTSQLIAAILTQQPKKPSEINARIPPTLENIILKALEKDKGKRFTSAGELKVALEQLRVSSTASLASTLRRILGNLLLARERHFKRDVILSASLLIAALTTVVWLFRPQPAISFSNRDWLLISDFENLTGDPIFDKSLAMALNVSLSQSKYANIYSRTRISDVLLRMGKKPDGPMDEQVAREVCQRENIRGLICPSIGKVGSRFLISARIVDPQTGDAVETYASRADDYNQVLTTLDRVVGSLREGLGESIVQVTAGRPLAKVTTTSLSALKCYSEAQQLWYKGQYQAARDLQESALKEDPDFAMAHAALGVYYSSFIFREDSKGKTHYERALGLADRTTEREKMTIRLQYESKFGTLETARSFYETFLRSYPDGIGQRYNYATLLRDRDELDEAIKQYHEVIRVAPDYAAAHINLATTYAMQEQPREALAAYDQAFKLEPKWITSGNLNHEYGFTLVSADEYEKAREVFTEGLSTSIKPQALRSLALLDLCQGKYRDAKGKLKEALLLNSSAKALLNEARNHLFMSILLEGEGNLPGVQRELDKAARCLANLSPQLWLSSRIGVGFARIRSAEKARRILINLRKDFNSNDPDQNSDLHRLEGEIELASGHQAQALELLMLADRGKHSPLNIESLARAQQIAGKADQAIGSYETLLKMRFQSDGWEPQQYWLAAHVHLAKLYITRKEKEKARHTLQQFFTLWKSADPDLPLNREAKRLNKTIADTR